LHGEISHVADGLRQDSKDDLAGPDVITLGPAGTDADAEARRHWARVRLTESFRAAMREAHELNIWALICAGYVRRAEDKIIDSWVRLHFEWSGRMSLHAVWKSPTKPMCIAGRDVRELDEINTLALHPSTEPFAEMRVPRAQLTYFDAKPLAVYSAAAGEVDACIGSVDVVSSFGLRVLVEFQPDMVWCAYRSSS
jgi:hypothetical protein